MYEYTREWAVESKQTSDYKENQMNRNHLKSLKRCRRANGTRHRSAFAAASFILTSSLLAVLLAACPSATPTPDNTIDNAAPGAPTITTATAGSETVTLEWTAPASTGFINGDGTKGIITKYTVYYSKLTITDRTAAGVESVNVIGSDTLTKEVINPFGTTEYFFRVTAWNAAGEGDPSDESSAAPAATTPPNAPPGAPNITDAATDLAGNIKLTWSEPSYTGYINGDATPGVITDYTVYYIESSTRSGDSSWGKNDAVSTVPIADESLRMRNIFLPENVGQDIFSK